MYFSLNGKKLQRPADKIYSLFKSFSKDYRKAEVEMIILSSYSFKTYNQEKLTCEVFVSGTSVTFKNYISDPLWLPFGVNKFATYEDLLKFYEERCFPRERANCKTVLKSIGLDYYDPELICRKTHGQQFDDFMWIQFSDEPQVEYKDIKLRD